MTKIVRTLLVIIEALLLIWCISGFAIYRVLNIGNLSGIAIFSILIILTIFFTPFKKFIKNIWQKKAGKIFLSFASLILVAGLVLVNVETACMIIACNNTLTGDETLVVLGSQVKRSGPSAMTRYRLDAAKEVLDKYPDMVVVLSGGQGADEPWSEAQGMCDYLLDKGLEKDRIYLEDKSTNTRENLSFSQKVIEDNGLNEHIAIVSNDFHIYRAGRIANRLGIENSLVPAKSIFALLPAFYIRELYAILADWFIYS